MTIDEAKEWLKLAVPIKALTEEEFVAFIQAVNLAVDAMCKYQKIEEIVKEWEFDHESMVDSMEKIGEVVKNG